MTTLPPVDYCTASDWDPFGVLIGGDSGAREDWLRARARCLTASQAAAALNLSRWSTFDDVVAEKRGEGREWVQSQPAWFGSMREECNLALLRDLLGVRVRANRLLLVRGDRQTMACTPDGLIAPTRSRQEDIAGVSGLDWTEWLPGRQERFERLLAEHGACPVDVKSVRSKNAYLWKDGPPTEYELQMQCDLAVLDAPFGLVAAFVDSDRCVCHLVERDELTSELLWDAADRLQAALR